MDDAPDMVRVQVSYARPERQILRELRVAPGTRIQDAIRQSGILTEVPDIDLTVARVGIYGKLKPLDTVLRDGDRVEIYRPLVADPKETRRRRAQKEENKKAR
ncbi:RnfH family protein [Noviherbaspirillum massiliense]|uniref:RnfH family protein n=1 Tax=Noviherbaspirillum massiliense TaxID=1465823 RepID=UPI0004744CFD|nr:RnfH family protein [Noviherbaspirillum massiliense]